MHESANPPDSDGLPAWPRGFAALATAQGCPPFDLMLLALGREFRDVDEQAALERVEDLGRALFGIASMRPTERAQHVSAVLSREIGLHAVDQTDENLYLDRVLAARRGHPALLGAVYVEAARRAGVALCLLSWREGWLVGELEGETLVVVDPAVGRCPPDPQAIFPLRRHCAHELAFCVLSGLARRFEAQERAVEARAALEQRVLLPVDHGMRHQLTERLGHRME